MSSQDDYLDELLKEMPLEEDEDGTDDGQTANRPDVEAVSEMTEDEIARLLDQGKAEGRQGQEKTRALGGDASAAQDVMGMLDKTEDRELKEIRNLLEKSDKNETIAGTDSILSGSDKDQNPADRLLADIEEAGEREVAGDAMDSKSRRAMKKEQRREQKEEKKRARQAAKAQKGKKDHENATVSAPEPRTSSAPEQKEPAQAGYDAMMDRELLDSIVSGAGRVGRHEEQETRQPAAPMAQAEEGGGSIADLLSYAQADLDAAEDSEADWVEQQGGSSELDILTVDMDEADSMLEDISEKPDDKGKKGGFLSKVVSFLTEEDEPEAENEDVQLSQENEEILKDLDKEGKLFSAPKFEHDYPFCWRCDTPLIYYARESWFIKMTAVKEDLIRNNNTINWIPESIGKGRFGDWLENVQDWGISRNRYWGTPLNVWECECGHQHAIGSRQELLEMSGNERALTVELHRPYIDEITIKCPECGREMHRVPEVIDCWFDSGAMPFAQHHYPFENQDLFEQQFPAQFISEAVDQTRGWFYSLLAESTLIFNKAPYENVIVLGHVQDENGQKMSKSKGNAVDPFDALATYGADAIRWYFYVNSAPWLPNRFHGKAVMEGQRKFMGTLWNTYAFFVLYANIDNFDATKYELNYDSLNVMDKWLLSKLNTVVGQVDDNLANYRIPETARALQEFVDDMSNWYVRRSRERFWAKGMEQDKVNAYMTLYTALVTICKAAAPMVPFITEDIYRNLVCGIDKSAPESIHLCDFPEVKTEWIDKDLEKNMDEVLRIVVMGRACRNAANIKNRQPIADMFVKAPYKLDGYYQDIIRDELNVKAVSFTDDVRSFTTYSFKPQLKTVGPKYGKSLNGIRTYLAEVDGNAAMDELKEKGSLTFDVNGVSVVLSEEDLLIDMAQTEGYVSDGDNEITVVLDTKLTPELIEEGFIREIISKIQTMRKEADFEVMDKIVVYCQGNDKIAELLTSHREAIQSEVLALEVRIGETKGYVKDWSINGEEVTLGVERP